MEEFLQTDRESEDSPAEEVTKLKLLFCGTAFSSWIDGGEIAMNMADARLGNKIPIFPPAPLLKIIRKTKTVVEHELSEMFNDEEETLAIHDLGFENYLVGCGLFGYIS